MKRVSTQVRSAGSEERFLRSPLIRQGKWSDTVVSEYGSSLCSTKKIRHQMCSASLTKNASKIIEVLNPI